MKTGLFRTELVRRVRDLISIGNVLDADSLEHLLAELCGLILADLFGSDKLAELFILVLLLERASLVPIDLDVNLLYDLLEYLIVEVGKELV